MRKLLYTMFAINNHASIHLWWKENLLIYQHVSKYYEHSWNIRNLFSTSYTSLTQATSHLRTLTDNIFSTGKSENTISANIVSSIFDHLVQFLFLPIEKFKRNNNKDINQRNFKLFDKETFLEDIQSLNWNNVLELDKKDVNNSFNKLFLIFETFIETYVPIQKLTKVKLKLK